VAWNNKENEHRVNSFDINYETLVIDEYETINKAFNEPSWYIRSASFMLEVISQSGYLNVSISKWGGKSKGIIDMQRKRCKSGIRVVNNIKDEKKQKYIGIIFSIFKEIVL